MPKLLISFVLLFLSFPLFAGDDATTPILVPLFYNGPGAYGSTWWTGVRIDNHMSVPFSSPGAVFSVMCPIPEGCESETIQPADGGFLIRPQTASGLLLYAPANEAHLVAFSARFGEGSDLGANGSELPVARAQQFRRDAVRLPAMPLHNQVRPLRTTLRIYGLDAIEGTRVRVEVRDWFTPAAAPRASKEYTLTAAPSPAGSAKPLYPAFGQILLQSEFPFELLRGGSFGITVVPLALPSGEVPRIWAFASTVDNLSQDVSIQQPQ
jgi:hypothetical protein